MFMKQNKYDEALEYYNKSLDIRINKLGKDHTDVADAMFMNHKINMTSLDIRINKLGKDHTDVACNSLLFTK